MPTNPRLRPRALLAATALIAAAWWLCALAPSPPAPAPGLVARVLRLRPDHGAAFARVVLAGIGLAGIALALLARPGVESWLAARWPAPTLAADAPTLGRARQLTVLALIVAVVGGHALCVLLQRSLWPWSHYSLYSKVYPDHEAAMRVLGVTPDGRTVALRSGELAPFSLGRLHTALDRMSQDHRDLTRPLGSLLPLYEANRGLGLHRGPALRAVRLCDELWDLRATVIDRDHPARARIVAEVERPGTAGSPGAAAPHAP